jgi:hypothetical protein
MTEIDVQANRNRPTFGPPGGQSDGLFGEAAARGGLSVLANVRYWPLADMGLHAMPVTCEWNEGYNGFY